jgi:hypothetical protein
MTQEKLEKLNQIARKIDYIQKELKALEYLKKTESVYLSAKDGRVLYDKEVSVRIPRSIQTIIHNEIEHKLTLELNRLKFRFESEE